jgi:hypothetical protein
MRLVDSETWSSPRDCIDIQYQGSWASFAKLSIGAAPAIEDTDCAQENGCKCRLCALAHLPWSSTPIESRGAPRRCTDLASAKGEVRLKGVMTKTGAFNVDLHDVAIR